jgi:uncharacterized Zn finger protein (UPF0148 family)
LFRIGRRIASPETKPTCTTVAFRYFAAEVTANMEEQTCPNCNVDVDPVELRQSHLRCPTCGYDMSEAAGNDPEPDWEEEEEGEDFEEDDEDELDEDEDEEKSA